MPALCFLWLHLPVFVFFFSWRVNAVRIAAILTKEAYLTVTIGQTRMLFSFGHIIISFKFRYKNSSQHMNECSGLCSCSEDDTIFIGKIWHIFGYVDRLSVGSTGAVFYCSFYFNKSSIQISKSSYIFNLSVS